MRGSSALKNLERISAASAIKTDFDRTTCVYRREPARTLTRKRKDVAQDTSSFWNSASSAGVVRAIQGELELVVDAKYGAWVSTISRVTLFLVDNAPSAKTDHSPR